MTAPNLWRWTDERGVQRLVGTDELRAALASAILPPTTLVWRDGMKEWAPASTVPELASAAFAGGEKPDGAFNPRSTAERERRATLVGLPTAAEVMADANVPVAVPSPGDRGARPAVTQVPPFGGPTPEPPVVPPAPRVPAPPGQAGGHPQAPGQAGGHPQAPGVEKPKPKRKITTSELDGLWATTTHSDEDDTIPRRARPSELAAAAAAAAEATAALRDGRGRKAGPPPAPRKAPPPLPSAAARLQARDAVTPKDGAPKDGDGAPGKAGDSARPPKPPALPARPPGSKSAPPPPPPRPIAAAQGPTLLAPVVPLKPVTVAEAPHPSGESPRPPVVRIKPPSPTAMRDAVTVEDLTADTKAAPFKMGGHGAPTRATTLTGVAAPVLDKPAPPQAARRHTETLKPGAREAMPPPAAAGPAAKPPKLPPGGPPVHAPAGPPARAPAEPPAAAAGHSGDGTKITKTLVSPRDSVDSIPGLADAIAIADELSDTAVTAPANGAVVRRPAADEEPTVPGNWPPNRAVGDEAAGGGNGHAALAVAAAAEAAAAPQVAAFAMGETPRPPPQALALAPRATHSSRPPPPPRAMPSHPRNHADPVTAPLPTDQLGLDPASVDLSGAPASALPESQSLAQPRLPSFPPPDGEASSEGSGSLRPPRRLDEQIAVPLSSLVGGGALLIGLVIAAFFVGRASSVPPPRLTAHPALAAVPVVARAALPTPPKPCWMVKQPAMWAPHASHRIPFDAVATRTGTLAIGYAHDARQAMGIEVDIGSGEVKSRLDDKAREEIERIVPTPAVEFRVARTGTGGALKSAIEVSGHDGADPGAAGADGGAAPAGGTSFAVGLAEGGIALASPPEGAPARLWALDGDEGLGAATVHPMGERGFALVFRRGGAIWGGFIQAGRKAGGELVKVVGSGGAVGKPAAAWNGREVAVIFADRPDPEGQYEIRVGHAAPGAIPAVTTVLPLPRGGPGGDAFAPDIAGLPDGRWLLMWTEGAAGARAVRAQTLTPDFRPLGDPIALSPPAGNFGQGVIGVVGDRAATVFLSKGSSSYELWGAVLQCGG